jgi:hypothetical protein
VEQLPGLGAACSPPRRHLACEPFDNLLQLAGVPGRLEIMRAFVRENDVDPR